MKSTAALALALGLTYGFLPYAAFAQGLEEKGHPQATVSSLPTYGLDVPARTALKTVIPSGWQLFVHQSAKLPTSVSWKVDDTWPQVLGSMAAAANLSVLVDWDARTVLIRTQEVASQEKATRAEIAQAATTPLPKFEVAPLVKSGDQQKSAANTVLYDVKTTPAVVGDPAKAAPLSVIALAPLKADNSIPVVTRNLATANPPVAPASPSAPVTMRARPPTPGDTDITAASAGAAVPMPTLLAPVSQAEAHPAVTALAVPQQPVALSIAKSETPAAISPDTSVVIAASSVAPAVSAVAIAVPQAQTTALQPPSLATALIAEPKPPVMNPLAAATEPTPLVIAARASSVLSAFEAAQPSQAPSTLSPPVAVPLNVAPTAGVTAVAVIAKPLPPAPKVEVVKPLVVVAPVVISGAQTTLSQRIANARDNAKQPGSVATPVADKLAREAARRSGAPDPLNDVMPELPEGIFNAQAGDSILPAAAPTAVLPVVAQASTSSKVSGETRPSVLPVIRTNPTPSMVAAQEAGVARNPPRLASTDKFTYSASVAWNKPSVRSVAQGIAMKYGMRLVWAAPEVQLRGPVTMLANSAQEDVYLLKKALGPSKLNFEVDRNNNTLNVTHEGAAYANAAEIMTFIQPAPADSEPYLTAAKVEQLPATGLKLTVNANEPLENAILRFARTQGYTVEWKVPGGFEAARLMEFSGENLAQVLAKVLPSLGVSADVYTRDKHIVVRPGEGRNQ